MSYNEAHQRAISALIEPDNFDHLAFTTKVTDKETYTIDHLGNRVTEEMIQEQQARQAQYDETPEVTADEIMAERTESSDNGEEELAVVTPEHGSNNGDAEDDEDHISDSPKDEFRSSDSDDEAAAVDQDNKKVAIKRGGDAASDTEDDEEPSPAGKKPIASTTRTTVPAGPRKKRWSEMPAWKKVIAAARGEKECPDNIDQIVADCLAYQERTELNAKNANYLKRALHNGFYSKIAQLAAAEKDRNKAERNEGKMEKKYDQEHQKVVALEKKLALAKKEIQQLKQRSGKSTVLAAKKSAAKGKGKETASTIPTFQLALPPIPDSRMTTTAPKATKPFITHTEMLLDQGVKIMRATDVEDWSDQAVNWVAMAESRPEIKYT
jgi:hypothetical protein